MKTKVQFLDLGKQPITNNFLIKKNPKNEFFYSLKLIFHKGSKLVSLAKFVPPKKMFNERYAHRWWSRRDDSPPCWISRLWDALKPLALRHCIKTNITTCRGYVAPGIRLC